MASLKEANTRRPAVKRRYSIFEQQQDPFPPFPANSNAVVDQTAESLMRHLVSQGIPYETVDDAAFCQFVQQLQPGFAFPTSGRLESMANRIGNPGTPHILAETIIGPISLSVDVIGDDDDKFLAFSIHYFEDFYDRKNVVFLRKMFESQITEENLMSYVKKAVSNYGYAQVHFTNLVAPNPTLAEILCKSKLIQRDYVCFYYHLSQFVWNLLNINEFREGVAQLRTFVRFVRYESAVYSQFRKVQLDSNGDVYLPPIDTTENWLTTAEFVTGCILLHDTLKQFAHRCQIRGYITDEQYQHLLYLQRILHECSMLAEYLSGPLNTISQIVPAIVSMRNFLAHLTRNYRLEKTIREAFASAFEPLTGGTNSKRLDIATLLDPRFGFRADLYSPKEWALIKEMVIQEFCETSEQCHERNYHPDVMKLSKTDRARLIAVELDDYYKSCTIWRPARNDSPFYWWGLRPASMALLPVLAREYLACPAVTIDCEHFFGDGGKFRQLCRSYHSQTLENCLNIASMHQQFRGRGANSLNTSAPPTAPVPVSVPFQGEYMIQVAPDDPSPSNAPTNSDQMYQYVPHAINEELITTEAPVQREEDVIQVGVNPMTAEQMEQMEAPEEEKKQMSEQPEKKRKARVPRPCAICQGRENTRRTSQETEKMFVLLNAVFRTEITIDMAQTIFGRAYSSVFCRKHFSEACSTIFELLHIEEPKNIPLASEMTVEVMKQEANYISGMTMDLTDFRNHLFLFTCKFSDLKITAKKARSYLIAHAGTSEGSTPDETPETKPSEESDDTLLFEEEEEEEADVSGNAPHPSRRKPCNRRCKLCNSMEKPENVKFTAMRQEKLLIMLAAVHRGEQTVEEACQMLEKVKKPYFCKLHFHETCDDVLQMLDISHPDNLEDVAPEKMKELAVKARKVLERDGEPLEMVQFRLYLEYFLLKYYRGAPASEKPETCALALDSSQNLEMCCFCREKVSGTDLIRLTSEAVKFYLHKTGSKPFDYICRRHVVFSTRGRLFIKDRLT